jgi:hypothetical protein
MIYIHPRIELISRIKEHSHAPLCCLKATWMFHLFTIPLKPGFQNTTERLIRCLLSEFKQTMVMH